MIGFVRSTLRLGLSRAWETPSLALATASAQVYLSALCQGEV